MRPTEQAKRVAPLQADAYVHALLFPAQEDDKLPEQFVSLKGGHALDKTKERSLDHQEEPEGFQGLDFCILL